MMDVICSICHTSRYYKYTCTGCMSEKERDGRVLPEVDERDYDTEDFRYIRLIELILSGKKVSDFDRKTVLGLSPDEVLTEERGRDMYQKRLEKMQARTRRRKENEKKAQEEASQEFRLF